MARKRTQSDTYSDRPKQIPACSPEARENGPIAVIENGDIIEIDIENRMINVELSDEEISKRLKKVRHPESEVSGWLALYQKLVHSADTGAILR